MTANLSSHDRRGKKIYGQGAALEPRPWSMGSLANQFSLIVFVLEVFMEVCGCDELGVKYKFSESENAIAASAISRFVNNMIGAFESGFVDGNTLTLAELYRIAQNHVKDNYNIDMPNMIDVYGSESYKACSEKGCCADCKKRILDNESRDFMCSLTGANTVASAICPHYDRDPDVPF